eukprot:EG_transcript_27869
MAVEASAPHIVTDSLTSLQTLAGWHLLPLSRVLRSPLRPLVRQIISAASSRSTAPLLEKVRAHDTAAIEAGHPKAAGNDSADFWAKEAALGRAASTWSPPPPCFDDPVLLQDASGSIIYDLPAAFAQAWWLRCRAAWEKRSAVRLLVLYPASAPIAWPASTAIFRRAVAIPAGFTHPVSPAAIKWVARVRTGCLATQDRLHRHRLGAPSPVCLCCRSPVEDDVHVLTGCPATGSAA